MSVNGFIILALSIAETTGISMDDIIKDCIEYPNASVDERLIRLMDKADENSRERL